MTTPYFNPGSSLKRIAQALNPKATKPEKRQAQVDGMDGSELVDKWMEVTRNTNFEMQTRSLEALVSVIGYRDIREFLSDNPGAQEKIVEFIREWADRNPEWKESLEEAIQSESGEDMDAEDEMEGYRDMPGEATRPTPNGMDSND